VKGNMMYKRDIKIKDNYDLVVVGGGMTGFSAAVAAARRGLKTAIIEKMGCLGGVATSAGVCHLLGGRTYDDSLGRHFRNVRGIFDELTDKLISKGAAIEPDTVNRQRNPHGWFPSLAAGVPFDVEKMKVAMDDMCKEAGVHIYYFTSFIDCEVEDEMINTLILHNKSGLFGIGTKLVADTTGDADVAYRSGCLTVLGRDEDNLMAPASLEMHVENVNKEELLDYIQKNNTPRFRELIRELRDKGIWTFPYEIFIAVQLNEEDVFMINTIRQVGVNGVDGESITEAMINGRKENMKLFEIMKEYFPGFKNARIKMIAPVVGIRETRRIVGKYVLTVEDLCNGKVFDDSIAVSSYGWDLPDPNKPSHQPMEKVKTASKFTHIPYRCLLPSPIKNLIVAGRCISVEREVLGPVRVMAPCMAMGQAAGIAAAISVKSNQVFSEIDVKEVQSELERDGCIYMIKDN